VTARPVIRRALADRDIAGAVEFYLAEAGVSAAEGFIDAVELAFRQISDFPESGSARYAQELLIPGLRSWTMAGYPWLVFYMAGEARTEVWRVLYAHRDIPAGMLEPDI
tara:strand:+ start:864 stop:1190 length:327 start_codon:yes stop_codon:yes gene_type:complete